MKPVPERFESLRSFIQETCDNTNTKFDALVARKMALYKAQGMKPGTREAWFLSQQAERFEKARDMWTTALAEASETAGRAEGNAEGGEIRHSLRSNKYEDYDKPITSADIETLRGIGRKSVNAFTSEDTLKSQKWAHKFYKQMGTKSPFFRAWFGEWRAHDNSYAIVPSKPGVSNSSNVRNADTKWSIILSKALYKETSHKNSHSFKNAQKYFPYSEEIVKNAILLDTITSEDKPARSELSAFFHHLYTYTDVAGYPALLKLNVEELIQEKTGEPIRRTYTLQSIEETRIPSVRLIRPNQGTNASSKIRVSDLYAIVKQYDKDFHSKDVHPALLNPDGTPKVLYHGTKYTFTQFKPRDSVNEFFFTNDINAARDYGEKQMSVYLKMSNPYEIDLQGMGDVAIYDALDHAHDNNYDGVIARNAYDGANTHNEYVVFSPTQIKSATDNIGTFDGNNPDIRYSLRESNIDDYTEAEYNKFGWARVNGVISHDENGDFRARLNDYRNERSIKMRGSKYPVTSDGKRLFSVCGHNSSVENVVIVSDGVYGNWSIDRVYRILFDVEDDINNVRGIVYEREKLYGERAMPFVTDLFGTEIIGGYRRQDFQSYSEQRTTQRPRNAGSGSGKNNRNYRFEQDGSGDNGEVEQTVKPQLRTTSETDAEFFVR